MNLLVLGLVVFLGIHSISIVAPAWRMRQVALRGQGWWKGVYSLVSAIGLVLLIVGYSQSRHAPVLLYAPPVWLRHVALLLMLPVFPLLFSASFPGRISRTAKHPMLLAVKLWATAHLLANGTLGDTVLFGAFLVWAVVDRISVKRRSPAFQHGPPAPRSRPFNDLIVIFAGLLVYGAFLGGLHLWLIGVSPLG